MTRRRRRGLRLVARSEREELLRRLLRLSVEVLELEPHVPAHALSAYRRALHALELLELVARRRAA